jgi:hypothetical protein
VEGIEGGKYQLWNDSDSVLVTEIQVFPRKRVLHVFLAAGGLAAVLKWQPTLVEFGRKHGCKYLTETGRKGWSRSLSQMGWSEVATTYALEL